MAVSTYTTNLTDVYAGAGSTTGWSALGGGASGLNAETDYFIQGTGMTSKNAFASSRKGMILNDGTDRASTIGTDGAVLMWCTHTTPNSLDTIANGGMALLVGSSTSDYKHYYVGGSDTIEFLGWVLAAVNPSETADEADAGTPTAVEDHFGMLFDLPSGGPTKGAPNAIDAIRVGRCDLIYSLGTSTDPDASFDLAVADKGDVTDRLGLIQLVNGSYFLSGLHQFGDTGVNEVDFTDSNKTLFWRDHPAVTAPFNTVEIQHATSVINMTNISWTALGTKSPGTWTTTDNATVNLTTCNFTNWGTFGFDTGTTVDTCTFLNCGAVTHNGATMNGSTIATPNVTANNSGLIYNVNADPNGEMDNMTFTKTPGVAHHAIEFGTSIPTTSITLTGCDFGTDFSATEDASVGDETFHFLDTTGTITLNLVGCTGNFGYRTEGVVVTVVADPVLTELTITDTDAVAISGARVLLETSSAAGPLPFEESVSIVQTAGTATVTHTSHGIPDGTNVVIRGTTQNEYNKVAVITVVNANSYTYAVDSGAVSPATGSPVASGVLIHGTTNGSGVIDDTRTYGTAQPFKGFIRDSSGSPYHQAASITGTVSTTAGFSATVALLSDE